MPRRAGTPVAMSTLNTTRCSRHSIIARRLRTERDTVREDLLFATGLLNVLPIDDKSTVNSCLKSDDRSILLNLVRVFGRQKWFWSLHRITPPRTMRNPDIEYPTVRSRFLRKNNKLKPTRSIIGYFRLCTTRKVQSEKPNEPLFKPSGLWNLGLVLVC